MVEMRSQQVAEAAGFFHVKPAGHVHPPQPPEHWVVEEAWEELGLRREAMQSIAFLPSCKAPPLHKYEVVYHSKRARTCSP